MPLDKRDNKERMKKDRAAKKEEDQNAIAEAIVAKLGDTLPGIILSIMSANVQLNEIQNCNCARPKPHASQQAKKQ